MEQAPPNHNIGGTNNLALASLILSISFVFIGPFGSVPGIICGNMAMNEYRRANVIEGRGMAQVGIVVGWIGVVLSVLGAIVAFLIFGVFSASFLGWNA